MMFKHFWILISITLCLMSTAAQARDPIRVAALDAAGKEDFCHRTSL